MPTQGERIFVASGRKSYPPDTDQRLYLSASATMVPVGVDGRASPANLGW